jgi:hypothetical protein
MPKFLVTVSKLWTEWGEVLIDAEDADDARDIAKDMLLNGSEEISWGIMDPETEDVESVQVMPN